MQKCCHHNELERVCLELGEDKVGSLLSDMLCCYISSPQLHICSLLRSWLWQAFPEELFSVLRTVHLLRGLSVGLGINYSCAEQWRPIAEEALYRAGRLKGAPSDLIGLIHRHIHLLEAALFLHSFSHAGWCLLHFVVFFAFSIWKNSFHMSIFCRNFMF